MLLLSVKTVGTAAAAATTANYFRRRGKELSPRTHTLFKNENNCYVDRI